MTTATLTRSPPRGARRDDQPCVIVVFGPDPARIGERLSLTPGQPLVLGRNAPELGTGPLDDARISSRHARLTASRQGLEVEDLGSKNGTFVAGVRAHRAVLAPGDLVQIGATFLQLAIEPPFRHDPGPTLLGGISHAMHRLRQAVSQAAGHERPVLILGPTGSGKERVAGQLHRASGRRGELVALNCSTLSPNLAESELFGHVRGAFSGASTASEGLFGRADRGTLFLDEIATLPLEIQPKLLRALQEGRIRRVGSPTEVPAKPRVLCATHADLGQMSAEGTFREDLYARLLGSVIRVPPLAERTEDLGWLAHALLDAGGHGDLTLSPELVWALHGARWPLNVRGLEQCLLSNAHGAEDGVLGLTEGVADFLEAQDQLARHRAAVRTATAPAPKKNRVRRPPRDQLVALLEAHEGTVGRVATALGVRRQQIYRWLRELELTVDDYRPR